MLTRVRYTGFAKTVMASLFPSIDPSRMPLYADDAQFSRSRVELEKLSFKVIHPVAAFGDIPVMVHEYAHAVTLLAIGPEVMAALPEYRAEAAAIAAEQVLAHTYPVYLPVVYERLLTRATPEVFGVVQNAAAQNVVDNLEMLVQRIAEGHHG